MAIAGTVFTGLAIVIISFWLFVFGVAANGTADYITNHQNEIMDWVNEYSSSIENNL